MPPGPSENVQNRANLLQERGDLDEALAVHKRAERLYRELGNKEGLSYSMGSQALILQSRGDLEAAMALHKEVGHLYGELGDREGLVVSLQNRAKILQDCGNLDEAMSLHKEVECLCREFGNREALSYSLSSQALIYQDRGDLDGAADLHKAAQQLYRDLRNREGIVASLENRARIIQERADFDGAMILYEEAECLYREFGNSEVVALSLRDQAKILQERKDLDRTLEFLALIFFALRAEAQLNFVPFNSTGIYALGENVSWTVCLAHCEAAPFTKYTYEIKKNNLDKIESGALCFVSGRAKIEAALDEPAMLYVTVNAEGAPPASAVHLGAAIAPTQLRTSVQRPADFDSFWDSKLHALSRIPLNPEATPVTASEGVELSRIMVEGWGSRTHGYLAKPTRKGKFPALVIFQYAGTYALRSSTAIRRATEGWLAFNVVAHDLPPEQAVRASCNYEAIGNKTRETSYFLKMYLRDVRALDYITGHPDWDGKTLVLMGTCMGGQQALVCSGLHPQVTAVIANQPSGADSNGDLHGRKAGYPYWPSDDPDVMKTALYFDIVNFAPRIKAPVLASVGFIDTTSPPAGIWTFLNQIRGPKELVTMIELDHTSRTPEKRGAFRSRSAEVLDILLRGGQFRPNQ
jgi:cephalosporin-C deacetylase-like acetyl esterase/tetratricopeptide (TPR) repeat protein